MMKFRKSALKMTIGVLIVVAILIAFFMYFKDIIGAVVFCVKILIPFIIAFILSLALNPIAEKMQKKLKLPKRLSAIIVIILAVGIVGGCVFGILWKIGYEIKSIYYQFPQIYENAVSSVNNLKENLSVFYDSLPVDIQNTFVSMGDNIQNSVTEFINNNYKPVVYGAGNVAKQLPSIFIGIIVFILALYFMISGDESVAEIISKIIPKKISDSMHGVCYEIKKYLGGYVKAQLIIMSVAFVIICVGLMILKIQYALIIALGIAVLDALPFFGSGAVLWPWALISFINSDFKTGVGMLIIYLFVVFVRQMIEPKIVSSSIGINPLFTLMSMYIGYKVFSIGGMILGPIILMIIISFYKAGAFVGIIKSAKKIFVFIKSEVADLFNYISMK